MSVLNWGSRVLGQQGGAAIAVAATVILWPNLPAGPVETRVTQLGVEPVAQTLEARITQFGVEVVTQQGDVRITQLGVEVVAQEKGVRITQYGVEAAVQEGGVRVTQVGLEVITVPVSSCEMQIPGGDGGQICTDEMSLPADSGGGTAEP